MPPPQDPLYAGLGQAVRIGTELLAALIVGGGLGWVVDTYLFGTIPWGTGQRVGIGIGGWDQECLSVRAAVARQTSDNIDKQGKSMEESPLHPFELQNWIPISLGGLDISINKAVVMMWVVVSLAAVLMVMAGSARKLVPGKLQSMAEMMVDFIRSIIMDTMGKEGMRFFPFIATLFLFILFCNLIGLIPGSYTVTSQIIVTAVFSCLVYGLSLVIGFFLHGVKFLGILVPPGTPWMAGAIDDTDRDDQSVGAAYFTGCSVICEYDGGPCDSRGLVRHGDQWRIVDRVVALCVHGGDNGLEVGIAFIQAYIFTILTCVYLGDAFHLHGHDEHAH